MFEFHHCFSPVSFPRPTQFSCAIGHVLSWNSIVRLCKILRYAHLNIRYTHRFGCLSTPISVSCGENMRASPHGAVLINRWNLMPSFSLYNWSDCEGLTKIESFAVPKIHNCFSINHWLTALKIHACGSSILTSICMQFQLTVDEIHEASPRHDFRMRIIQTGSTNAHVLSIDAFRASGNWYHFSSFQIQIFCHHNSSQYFSSTIIFNIDRCFSKLLQNKSVELIGLQKFN